MRKPGKRWGTALGVLFTAALIIQACNGSGAGEDLISSRSYQGHESDLDSNNFVSACNHALGTRLDDCQTCHSGATFTYDDGGETREVFKNACDYCHLIIHPTDEYNEPMPAGYADTLNPYGEDYVEAGRDIGALKDIGGDDSDNDGFSNKDEIDDLKYPGDPDSKPGQETAPAVVVAMAELQAMTPHDEFLLCNSHKQEFDNYAGYRGVKIKDLLEEAGVDTGDPGITGITVIAPDGYMKDFDIGDIVDAYPAGLFHAGLGTDSLGTECGFVQYPDVMPEGLRDGGQIPGEQWLMLAYERDGMDMEPSYLDITSGKINGEGPFRIIVPQSEPGTPDRGSRYSPTTCDDGYDYDDSADHNAGDMVRGVVIVRVNPLPEGYEDFDYYYGGWAYVDNVSVMIYGYGISG